MLDSNVGLFHHENFCLGCIWKNRQIDICCKHLTESFLSWNGALIIAPQIELFLFQTGTGGTTETLLCSIKVFCAVVDGGF